MRAQVQNRFVIESTFERVRRSLQIRTLAPVPVVSLFETGFFAFGTGVQGNLSRAILARKSDCEPSHPHLEHRPSENTCSHAGYPYRLREHSGHRLAIGDGAAKYALPHSSHCFVSVELFGSSLMPSFNPGGQSFQNPNQRGFVTKPAAATASKIAGTRWRDWLILRKTSQFKNVTARKAVLTVRALMCVSKGLMPSF
jgi:hypothetical protein